MRDVLRTSLSDVLAVLYRISNVFLLFVMLMNSELLEVIVETDCERSNEAIDGEGAGIDEPMVGVFAFSPDESSP